MVGGNGQILLHSRFGSSPVLQPLDGMRDSSLQDGDGLGNRSLIDAGLLSHSVTYLKYMADGCSRSAYKIAIKTGLGNLLRIGHH